MAVTSLSASVAAGSNSTVALCIIRFTAAVSTPGSFSSARCTRPEHAAQVIPETGIVTFVMIVSMVGAGWLAIHEQQQRSNQQCGRPCVLQPADARLEARAIQKQCSAGQHDTE